VKFFPIGISSALDVALIILSDYMQKGYIFDKLDFFSLPYRKSFIKEKIIFGYENKITHIFFIDKKSLFYILMILEEINYDFKIILMMNLAKREIINNMNQVYKLFRGNITDIKHFLDLIQDSDDIVLALHK